MNVQTKIPTEIRLLPLAQLTLHPINPRQDVPGEDVQAMAESLSINGLVQNLAVLEEDGRFGVVAGGKRLRALHLLAEEGWGRHPDQPRYDQVPCRVTSDPLQAQAWAIAENVTRSDLNPADEVRAYRAMADRGSAPEMIARAFAKSVPHVQRRLALAALAPEVLDALKAQRISIDVAKALTLAKDAIRQVELMEAAAARGLSAAQVRGELTQAMIRSTDRRARFVGVEVYLAAGGALMPDLFDGHEFLHDEALLDRLFTEKLAAEAGRVRTEEGWKWAELVKDPWLGFSRTEYCEPVYAETVELPEGDAEELERLDERDGIDPTMTDEEHARLEELRARADGDFNDETRASAGVFVLVNQQGRLEVARAYRRAEDLAAADATGRTDTAAGGADRVEKTGGGEKPLVPQNCLDDLRRIRQLAHQTAMLGQHELLLDLLAYQLDTNAPGYLGALSVSVERPNVTPEKDSGLHVDKRLPNQPANYRDRLDVEAFKAFCARGKKHRNEVLTRHLARSVNGSTYGTFCDQLFAAAGGAALIRKVWSPDATNFFGRVRADYLDRIWAELLDLDPEDDRRGEFGKLNRRDKAKKLEELFADASVQEAHGMSREMVKRLEAWVPAEMMER